MKNNEIHNGLARKEIRDFLGLSFLTAAERRRKKDAALEIMEYDPKVPFVAMIHNQKNAVEVAKNYLEKLEAIYAVSQLIEANGWQEFDVSNETEKFYEGWMSFIGTEKEHKELLEKIKQENT